MDKIEKLVVFSMALSFFAFGFSLGVFLAKLENRHTPTPEQPTITASADTLSSWAMLQLAIAITESQCNPNATGTANDAGILQITPIYALEASRLSSDRTYSHNEAYDSKTSLEMFSVVQDYHNPNHDIDKAIKLHNKAPWYARKVKDNLEFVQRYEAVRSLL